MATSTTDFADRAPAASGRGVSLHIGLNYVDPAHYSGWDGELNACEFDAEDMRLIAEAQGFEPRSLIRSDATRDAVREAFGQAAAVLGTGDTFLVTYSGHGGSVPDTSGDEDDRNDESWCLYDGQILDDELYELWGQFAPGVRVQIVSDSCHSGTVFRNINGQTIKVEAELHRNNPRATPRAMPLAIAGRTYRANRDFYDNIQADLAKRGWDKRGREREAPLSCSVRLFSGCADPQFSYDGVANGQFTEQLLKVWSEGRFKGNHKAFHTAILAGMPDNQTPQHGVIGTPSPAWDAQTPFTR